MNFSALEPYSLSIVHSYGINLTITDQNNIEVFIPVIDFHVMTKDGDHHLVSMITNVRDPDARRAIKLASTIAEGFTPNFNNEILVFGKDGNEIVGAIDFNLNDIVNSELHNYKDIKPFSQLWVNHFFITVHEIKSEDGVSYHPSLSLNSKCADRIDHAITVTTIIRKYDIDEAITEAIAVGFRLSGAYKDEIIFINAAGISSVYDKKVSYYMKAVGYDSPKTSKYLH